MKLLTFCEQTSVNIHGAFGDLRIVDAKHLQHSDCKEAFLFLKENFRQCSWAMEVLKVTIYRCQLHVNVVVTSLKPSSKLGHSRKDPYPTHRGNFRHPEIGGGGDCLKNILNLYKMSGEGVWIFFGTTYSSVILSSQFPNIININSNININKNYIIIIIIIKFF